MQGSATYELIDFGDGARLERFGSRLVDRPHPGALGARHDPGAWTTADLRYDRDRGWTGPTAADAPWSIDLEGVSLELRPTEAGQVGLFPEHAAMVPWLQDRVRAMAGHASAATGGDPLPAVLHLFAYTGLATLAMTAAGAAVTHVDSSRPTISWARRNAERSGLHERPIRWIVDDAMAFAEREVRRGRRYAGVVLDPPTYGHGPGRRSWQLVGHLPELMAACAALLEPRAFVLLTAHTPGVDPDRLADVLAAAMPRRASSIDRGDLFVATMDGRRLELGAFARASAGAS